MQTDDYARNIIRATFQAAGTLEYRQPTRFHTAIVLHFSTVDTPLIATLHQGTWTFLSTPGGKPARERQYASTEITPQRVEQEIFEHRVYCLEDPD
jgi:hypothetical protein